MFFNPDEFYGKTETDTTPGQYNPTPVSQRRQSRRKTTGDVELQFGTRQITQVGGYPLLERAHRHLELRQRLSRGLHLSREANGFTASEISMWLLDQKHLGCRRLYHADQYRYDPILEEHYGIEGLPSDSTVGRYLRGFDPKTNEKLTGVVDAVTHQGLEETRRTVTNRGVNEQDGAVEVVLDIDGTELTVYGDQENAREGYSHRKKDSRQYRMLGVFIAGMQWWLDLKLLGGNHTLKGYGKPCVESARQRLPTGYRVGGIRGDTALYNGEDIKQWVEAGYCLGISAPLHAPLKRCIGSLSEEDWERYEQEDGELIADVAQIEHQPPKWDHGPYSYVITRRKRDRDKSQQEELFDRDAEYDYFAYLVVYDGSLLERYRFAVSRCNVESCIKESKIGFDAQEVPHREFEANRAYLQHVQLAYNERIMMGLGMLDGEPQRYQRERLARELILIPGQMIHRGSQWLVSLVEWWPWKASVKKAWKARMPAPAT